MMVLIGLLTVATLFYLHSSLPPQTAVMDCPKTMAQDEVCVFTDDHSIIAINPTAESVKVVVQIQRIENVELVYRYPFVEELPPSSSRLLIKYKIKVPEQPFALDYDWGWKAL
jgi:hypothetical protein